MTVDTTYPTIAVLQGAAEAQGLVQAKEVTFTESTAAGVYTGSVTVPADAWLLDIKIWNDVYWTAATTAAMIVGDVGDPNGWYDAIDLKATDIVAGADAEVIDFNNPGGQEGLYLVTATGERAEMYSASARIITGEITTTGATGNAGRTRMLVLYVQPSPVTAATKVAS